LRRSEQAAKYVGLRTTPPAFARLDDSLSRLHGFNINRLDSKAYAAPRLFGRTWHAFRYMSIERKPNASHQTTYYFRRITMKTLIIADLARTEQLDRSAMALVRGGFKMGSYGGYSAGDVNYAPSFDSSITATQNLVQMQDVLTATANGSAFVNGVTVHSDVDQDGQNKIIRRS
jgi:hypothetical protein